MFSSYALNSVDVELTCHASCSLFSETVKWTMRG
jgi:hypothetical protein